MPNDLSTFIIWIMILVSKLLSQSLSFSFGSWSNLLQLILSLQIEYIKSRELWEDSILWTIQLVMLGSLVFLCKSLLDRVHFETVGCFDGQWSSDFPKKIHLQMIGSIICPRRQLTSHILSTNKKKFFFNEYT
jgi:hypothetical protein